MMLCKVINVGSELGAPQNYNRGYGEGEKRDELSVWD